jgi:thiol-disulfide isomerase/thioredoxin
MHAALLGIRLLLAAVFALAGLAKLADLGGSRTAVAGFGVPDRLASWMGTLLPLAELAVAGALLPAGSARYGALGAVVLLGGFAAAIARSMARGESPECHCFGRLHSEAVGRRTLVRNATLAGLAGVVAVLGWSDPGPGATDWIGRLSGPGAVAVGAGLALAALAVLTAAALLAVLRQNGRLLVRVDQLEARLDASGAPSLSASAWDDGPRHGLPIGTPAPEFMLAGLYGEAVTLESLRSADAPVLLVFTDPGCGPCTALMPQVSTWQHEHAGRLTIAVLTRGSVQDNRAKSREHGIGSVWLDEGLTVYEAYRAKGTPGAVLIDADGRIASAVVAGADAISGLVASATNPPTVPVVQVPAGLPMPPRVPPVGAKAPSLELTDLAGESLALSVPDRDTLVLFWNPGCGFCQQMLDQIREFELSPPPSGPRLVLISTGPAADNEAMGLQAPIALDPAFAAGSAFGTTGTPSAILLDRTSRVASALAVGAPQVMALATAGSDRSLR